MILLLLDQLESICCSKLNFHPDLEATRFLQETVFHSLIYCRRELMMKGISVDAKQDFTVRRHLWSMVNYSRRIFQSRDSLFKMLLLLVKVENLLTVLMDPP